MALSEELNDRVRGTLAGLIGIALKSLRQRKGGYLADSSSGMN